MLKITKITKVTGVTGVTGATGAAVLSKRETTLRLDGRIAGQWVALLRDSAESALTEGLKLTIDLKNISFIDCEGIVLLRSLIERGVDPVNAPLFVNEQIKKCHDQSR